MRGGQGGGTTGCAAPYLGSTYALLAGANTTRWRVPTPADAGSLEEEGELPARSREEHWMQAPWAGAPVPTRRSPGCYRRGHPGRNPLSASRSWPSVPVLHRRGASPPAKPAHRIGDEACGVFGSCHPFIRLVRWLAWRCCLLLADRSDCEMLFAFSCFDHLAAPSLAWRFCLLTRRWHPTRLVPPSSPVLSRTSKSRRELLASAPPHHAVRWRAQRRSASLAPLILSPTRQSLLCLVSDAPPAWCPPSTSDSCRPQHHGSVTTR